MANPQGRKGHEGEVGVRDWFNQWFPYHDQGIGASIMTTGGSNDIGDIEGVPFTMVEVKNHKNPVLGSLVANAEWKASNAKRVLWVLVVKRRGFSNKRAGHWYAVTTVKGLDSYGFKDGEGRSLNDIATEVGEHTMRSHPKHQALSAASAMEVVFNVAKCYNEVLGKSHDDMDGESIGFTIFPRRGTEPEDWFVITSLNKFCTTLENSGILPRKEERNIDG